MKLTWFDEARTEARTILNKKGGLRYRDLERLLCFESYLPDIEKKQAATLRLLLEIAAVRHVSDAWTTAFGSWQGRQFDLMLESFDYYIARPICKDHPIAAMPDMISLLENNAEDFIDRYYTKSPVTNEKVDEGALAIQALSNAGIFIFIGDVERITLYCQNKDRAEDGFFNFFYPDPYSTIAAIDALHACGGQLDYRPFGKIKQKTIQYWTWYLDEAFPEAVAEANKRLGIS